MTEKVTHESLENFLLQMQEEMMNTIKEEDENDTHDDLLTYPSDRAETIEEVITEIRKHFGMKEYSFEYP